MIVGIGVDVVGIARAQRLLASHGRRVLGRTCTTREAAYIQAKVNPAQHLAARLAAKEAAYKALAGTSDARRVAWKEIEVLAANGGPPQLLLYGRARTRAAQLGVARAWLSISHSDEAAVALVVLESSRSGGDK